MSRATARIAPPNSVSAGIATHSLVGGIPSAYASEVLEIVAQIPPGKVLSYGDIAELVGRGSGRAVGAVMSRHGHEVPWHRVVLSSGYPNPAGPHEALRLLVQDGTPLAPNGERVNLVAARWNGPAGA
jgi:methylated-DNA-protein-cysteine methyltransferase-like protein